jgi:hypothetical protein
MLCPLKQKTFTTSAECDKEECEWYDCERQQCYLVSLIKTYCSEHVIINDITFTKG